MYTYEIIIENCKVKTNDFDLVLKILNSMLDKNYNIFFKNNKINSSIKVIDIFDIAMIKDNMI